MVSKADHAYFHGCRTSSALALGLLTLACVTEPCTGGSSNSSLDVSSDGRWLVCANRDSGTVTVVDLPARRKVAEIPVGAHPEGVSFLGSSHHFAVAVYGDDRIVFADAGTGKQLGETPVWDEPYGLASNAAGDRLFVTLDYPGQVVEIDTSSRSAVRQFSVAPFLRGIALSRDEQSLLVTEFLTAKVSSIETKTGKIMAQWAGASTDNLARQIVAHPRRPKAYVPHIRSRVSAAHGEGSIFPYVAVISTHADSASRRTRIPLDAFLGNLVTANPWEVALSPDGQRCYVVFSGTDDLFACDVVDDDYREISYRGRLQLGHNPRAVRVTPDGRSLLVYNALDFEVVVYDAETLAEQTRIAVCDNPLPEAVHRGKVLFYSALQPMVGRRWIACSSCHPDGQPDGRTWQNPEGLRNTQPLAGVAWTHPLHWSADRDEVQDFEHTIRGDLMQGRGLLSGDLPAALGDSIRTRSSDLDALAAYVNSLAFEPSPYARQGLTAAADRGRRIFLSSETGCATCHPAPLYTDSVPRPPDQIVRHDVGTGNDDPSEKMGAAYDTPTLLGVYRSAPYLHHGRAATLEEVLTTGNPADRHGKTSHLDGAQRGFGRVPEIAALRGY